MGFAQTDPQWKDKTLGSGPETIGSAGCYLTTFADFMQWEGHDTNPAQLDDDFEVKGIFQSGDLLAADALHNAFSDLWTLESKDEFSGPADLSKLDTSTDGVYVAVRINYPNGLVSDPTHFMPVFDGNPANPTVVDSWDGHVKPLSNYGDPATIVSAIMRYRALRTVEVSGTPVAPPAPNSSLPVDTAPGIAADTAKPINPSPVPDAAPSEPAKVDAGTAVTPAPSAVSAAVGTTTLTMTRDNVPTTQQDSEAEMLDGSATAPSDGAPPVAPISGPVTPEEGPAGAPVAPVINASTSPVVNQNPTPVEPAPGQGGEVVRGDNYDEQRESEMVKIWERVVDDILTIEKEIDFRHIAELLGRPGDHEHIASLNQGTELAPGAKVRLSANADPTATEFPKSATFTDSVNQPDSVNQLASEAAQDQPLQRGDEVKST